MSSAKAFEGRVVVVTGGSRGIGAMIAEGFVLAGATVFISARHADACEATATRLSARGICVSVPGDLTLAEDREQLIATIRDAGRLNVLVNNAGATWGAPIDEHPLHAFDKVLSTNVTALFALTQASLPLLRAAAGAGEPARVINIGSVNGSRVPKVDNFAYAASKAGVHMLTQHLASTLARDGITVNAIAPGPFPSKMMAHVLDDPAAAKELVADVPLGRIGNIDDITGLCEFLAGPRAGWITGAVIPLDGGVSL